MIKTINFLYILFNIIFYSLVVSTILWALKVDSDNDNLTNKDFRFNLIRADIQMKNIPPRLEESTREFWSKEHNKIEYQVIENIKEIKHNKIYVKKIDHIKKEILIEPDKIVPPPPKIETHKIFIKLHTDTT